MARGSVYEASVTSIDDFQGCETPVAVVFLLGPLKNYSKMLEMCSRAQYKLILVIQDNQELCDMIGNTKVQISVKDISNLNAKKTANFAHLKLHGKALQDYYRRRDASRAGGGGGSKDFPEESLFQLESRVFQVLAINKMWCTPTKETILNPVHCLQDNLSIPWAREGSLGKCLVAAISFASKGLLEQDEHCKKFVKWVSDSNCQVTPCLSSQTLVLPGDARSFSQVADLPRNRPMAKRETGGGPEHV